jgi:CubicO group peptidase (beta-lactamase class C family)
MIARLGCRRHLKVIAVLALAAQVGAANAQDLHDRIAAVESGLLPRVRIKSEPVRYTLEDRMRFYGVPGVSIAVIDQGHIAWAKSYGVKEVGGSMAVDTATVFLAGSISKPVAATAIMTLVDRGVMSLDADINTYLRSWKVPENAFTLQRPVTLRGLLTHTAGTTVQGFPGYPRDAPIPTITQILRGEPPAKSGAVVVDILPGAEFRYSGGGTIIAQLAAMDVSGESFPDFMRKEVLEPFGMRQSTFENPLPEPFWDRAASGHDWEGTPLVGKWAVYPEMAAAGLWTTAADLARWVIGIQRAWAGTDNRTLSRAMVRQMLSRQNGGPVGLGPYLQGSEDSAYFSHSGADLGFRALVFGSIAGGRGAAVLTNGERGMFLAPEILNAIAAEYNWPGFLKPPYEVVELDRETMRRYIGTYHGDGDFQIVITGDQLYVLHTGAPVGVAKERLLAEPNGRMISDSGTEYAFEKDAHGVVRTAVIYWDGGGTGRAIRVED